MVNVVKFTTEAAATEFAAFIHSCLSGNESGWTGLTGYNASRWAFVDKQKNPSTDEWAFSVDSPAIKKYRELNPGIDDEVKVRWPGLAVEQVDRGYWTPQV